MKRRFKDVRFRSNSLALIAVCNTIIDSYQKQRLRLTLRQLYYQLVSRNIIPNVEKSYKNLSSLVSDARLAGLMDWNAIEDRVRRPQIQSQWDSIPDIVDSVIDVYRRHRWAKQNNYVELWVEKDALAGVLAPIAREYHITLMVNRGYSSQSAMFESAERFARNTLRYNYTANGTQLRTYNGNRALHLLYLGDHDPSGEDMVRDVRDRLAMFGVGVSVTKVALTMDQIEEHNPPPNPAKITDPRAAGYIAKYGNESWEVDALPPEVLTQLIEEALDELVDRTLMDAVIAQEEKDKQRLQELMEAWQEEA